MTADTDLTRNESLVLDALRGGEAPLSAYQLLDELRPAGLRAPPQVYRALKSLGDRGLVHKVDSRNAYVACAHSHAHGHAPHAVAFLVCEDCGRVEEVGDAAVDAAIVQLAKARGFALSAAALEIRGRCTRCSAAA
jgi:Fur family transcriptional regulator, zinc uptake regulator